MSKEAELRFVAQVAIKLVQRCPAAIDLWGPGLMRLLEHALAEEDRVIKVEAVKAREA